MAEKVDFGVGICINECLIPACMMRVEPCNIRTGPWNREG